MEVFPYVLFALKLNFCKTTVLFNYFRNKWSLAYILERC